MPPCASLPTPFPLHTPPCPPPQKCTTLSATTKFPTFSTATTDTTHLHDCYTPPPPQYSPPSLSPPPHKSTSMLEKETVPISITHNDTPNLTDILSNLALFNAHISEIDQALKRSPTRNSRNTSPHVTQNDNVTFSHSLPSFIPHKAFHAHLP